MKIYIAGKYTGLKHEDACAKFDHTEQQLLAAGIAPADIVNPMKIGIPKDMPWTDAINICLHHLKRCDAIFIQNDWRDSFGARREITRAMEMKLQVYYEETGDMQQLAMEYQKEQAKFQPFTTWL